MNLHYSLLLNLIYDKFKIEFVCFDKVNLYIETYKMEATSSVLAHVTILNLNLHL